MAGLNQIAGKTLLKMKPKELIEIIYYFFFFAFHQIQIWTIEMKFGSSFFKRSSGHEATSNDSFELRVDQPASLLNLGRKNYDKPNIFEYQLRYKHFEALQDKYLHLLCGAL